MKKKVAITGILILSILANAFSSYLILKLFPTRVVNPDLLFLISNPSAFLESMADILFFVNTGIFIYYVSRQKEKNIEYYILGIAIMYMLRAVLGILTPMMRPTGVDFPSHGLFREYLTQMVMFPSGHLGFLSVLLFFIEGEEFKNIKMMYFVVYIGSLFTMILSKGHYSIDIVGGIMLAYIVTNEMKKRFPNRTI